MPPPAHGSPAVDGAVALPAGSAERGLGVDGLEEPNQSDNDAKLSSPELPPTGDDDDFEDDQEVSLVMPPGCLFAAVGEGGVRAQTAPSAVCYCP